VRGLWLLAYHARLGLNRRNGVFYGNSDTRFAARRWVAAHANVSTYGEAYAAFDARRAGMDDREIAALAKGGHSGFSAEDRAALEFARMMTVESPKVTDAQFADLVKSFGEKKTAAMVLGMAYANFQDRQLIVLGATVEEGGPMAPVEDGGPLAPLAVTFDKTSIPPVPPRDDPSKRSGPAVPTRVDDPEWTAEVFDDLQKGLSAQRSNEGRIRVPTYEQMLAKLPPGAPRPNSPTRIKWTLVCMGYQPELAMAWSACTRSFGEEAKQDRVFEESQFWVVTRTIHCFY